jgi:hypothetical protein
VTVPASLTSFVTGPPVAARASAIYTAQIVDGAGAGIPAAALATLTLSLFDAATGAVVDGVSAVNILNSDRGAVDASGNLTVTLRPADTAIFGAAVLPGRLQYRSMVIDWTYNGGGSVGRHQCDFAIVALAEA